VRATSQIGKFACRLHLNSEDILIAIRTYLDSSGKLENNYLTLAAFFGPDEVWAEFETKWQEVLHNHVPRAEYIHMRELVRQLDGFDRAFGWTQKNCWELVIKCLMFIQHLDKQRFRMFYCAIDLEAWRKLKAETYQLPDPIELCNESCSEIIMKWYLVRYPDIISHLPALHYFFDRDEYFKQPFEDKWKAELAKLDASKGDWSVWSLVEEVSTVADMRKVPGIQAADVLAWAVNRENTAFGDLPGVSLSHIMRSVIPSGSIVWNEAKMREKFRPLIHLS